MAEFVARVLFPVTLMLGVALWLKGYTEVGDGFSAGAVAGLGAIVQYVCLDRDAARRTVGARWALRLIGGGVLGLVAMMLGPVLFGMPPVTHLPPPGGEAMKFGMLELHTATLFDLAVALVVYGSLVATLDHLFPAWAEGER